MTGDIKKLSIVCGHYGAGKTNIAVNLAINAKKLSPNSRISIADYDIVNPYFRTADCVALLKEAGIVPLIPEFANTNVDLPALPQDVYSILDNPTECAIMDIGGDDRGAYALGRYADAISDILLDRPNNLDGFTTYLNSLYRSASALTNDD